ncbi:uncharacterized protein LOC143860143 [Tasmannia lanceolata]|uniref:uncharacterized protein LOC143860143 n=1 Tax=Tasmannia lanceolata TaxID=3420 RepID=UPI004064AA22
MIRYVHWSFLFFFFYSMPVVFSQLSQYQTNIITRLASRFEISYWNTTEPNPCSWKGVGCSGNYITKLSLSLFGISSTDFLVGLCQIDSIQYLDLSNNLLNSIHKGFISDCGKINGLKMLNFSNNMLSGFLPAFNGFGGLQFLDLSYNLLTGNVTFQLDGLVQLRSLNLSHNSFNGTIPTNLGKGVVLEELQLSKNQFQSQIPEEIMNYTNLTLLDLSENSISGSVPAKIGELSKLETLLLSSNNLTGVIPQSLSRIKTLSRFAAHQNNFTGSIPQGISTYLRNLDLSYNTLRGLIPSDLLSPPNLQAVDLTSNLLEGAIPTNISRNLFRLRLSINSLNGSIPLVIGELFNLTYLEVEGNMLTGGIPLELVNCVNLTLLNLAQNQLQGSLPKGLGKLKKLAVMNLNRNHLYGEIPAEISQLQNLLTLNLSQNSFSGAIPSAISSLPLLLNLNLGGNEFNGSIPDGIGNLNTLLELQLGGNMLSGEIPLMPYNLQIALNLSSNLFTGSIPYTFRILEKLEVLDLSNNGFTGKVPFLFQLGSLRLLDLSNNQLFGTLPHFRFLTIVNISGNRDLVAPPSSPPTRIISTRIISRKQRIPTAVVIVVTVAGAVLGTGLVVAVIFILVSRRSYQVNDEHLPEVISGHLITADSIHRSSIDFTRAMEAVNNPANIMLKDRFSTYYKAIMPCGKTYCVKKLNGSDIMLQFGSHERFTQALEMLGSLSNSKVMSPLGYALTDDSAYVFYECVPKGTLFDFLHKSSGAALDWPCRYCIALGIAEGLAFLHECNEPVVILNLSTKTTLLKSLNEPQIADIELHKLSGGLSNVAGSVAYIPPEFAYTMRVTMTANVYSFGVVLLELLTGKPPINEGTELAKWVLSHSSQSDGWEQILDSSVSQTSPEVRSQMLSILKVAQACVSISPDARPKMKSVVRMLLNAR